MRRAPSIPRARRARAAAATLVGPLVAIAGLAAVCGCGATAVGSLYVKAADSAFAGGRWGDAMVAYDAACEAAPADPVLRARRTDAAARWVEAMAPEVARATPPEKALVLLDSLAAEGRKRGAEAAVKQHVVPLLDGAVAKAWSEEPGDDPKALWQAVRRGEMLTQSLPDDAPPRLKLASLKKRAATVLARLAGEAKHPGSAYVYEAMAARMSDGKAGAAAHKALAALTAFDYQLTLEEPTSCPGLADEFRKRLAFFKNLDPYAGGLPAQVFVAVDCVPLAPPRQRTESRQWVDSHVEYTPVKSCSEHRNQVVSGSYSVTSRQGMGNTRITTYTDVPPTYATVPDCSTSYRAETVSERKSDVVTITTQEYGFNARGTGVVVVHDKAYRMPISARVVFEKVTTAGKVFGRREDFVVPSTDFLPLTAHGIWLEMVYLNEKAHEGYVAELIERAKGAQGDSRLGDMVSAVRVHQRVTGDYAKYFGETLALDDQELRELVLDAPRVKSSLKVAGDYRLELPKLDANVATEAAAKKKAAGIDDFK